VSVFIRTRKLSDGRTSSYSVKYRRGGAAYAQEHAGSFRTLREAKAREQLVASWLAAGQDPKLMLLRLSRPRMLFRDAWEQYKESLKDVSASYLGNIDNAEDVTLKVLGTRDPFTMTKDDGMDLVNALVKKGLAPGTIRTYYGPARRVLDFLEIDPNPLASKHVRFPRDVREEVTPMSGKTELEPMLAAMEKTNASKALVFAATLMEAAGLRLGDAKKAQYGDVDFYEGRLRISAARGKSKASRWVPVPRELMDVLVERKDGDSRERLLLPELSRHDLNGAMTRACQRAGIRHFHPHDLRHRRISLWMAQGYDPALIKSWVGHADLTTTMNVYTHVVVDPTDDRWFVNK
jgi:integrase